MTDFTASQRVCPVCGYINCDPERPGSDVHDDIDRWLPPVPPLARTDEHTPRGRSDAS